MVRVLFEYHVLFVGRGSNKEKLKPKIRNGKVVKDSYITGRFFHADCRGSVGEWVFFRQIGRFACFR